MCCCLQSTLSVVDGSGVREVNVVVVCAMDEILVASTHIIIPVLLVVFVWCLYVEVEI